jgi:hypothetical protein
MAPEKEGCLVRVYSALNPVSKYGEVISYGLCRADICQLFGVQNASCLAVITMYYTTDCRRMWYVSVWLTLRVLLTSFRVSKYFNAMLIYCNCIAMKITNIFPNIDAWFHTHCLLRCVGIVTVKGLLFGCSSNDVRFTLEVVSLCLHLRIRAGVFVQCRVILRLVWRT